MSDYDSPWKETLERYLPSFLAFFFPESHADIDWGRGYDSLDAELQQVAREGELGKRLADKLFRVWRGDGKETWVLIHIEVQNQPDSEFAERMFVYNYRLYDRFRRPVVSMAVLGDERVKWRPNMYGYALWGCKVQLEFPLVKLLDYGADLSALETMSNPFGVVVLAHLQTLATRQDFESRKSWKLRVAKRLLETGREAETIRQLFRVIDWMMVLPSELEKAFRDELRQYEEETKMPYITSIERLAMEEGRQEGRQEGRLEGRQEGRQEGKAIGLSEGIALALEIKFDEAGRALQPALEKIHDLARLRSIYDAIRSGATLAHIREMLG